MKVGTICKLKVNCLGNKAGTLGVVFYDYNDGFQAIFENGNYDGFSTRRTLPYAAPSEAQRKEPEADYFLEKVGFEESLAGYQFKNVVQVEMDYRRGLFNIVLSEKWQTFTEGFSSVSGSEPEEYEKCKVCVEDGKWPWLYFKREKDADIDAIYMLSAAMDYADFSHFEYAEIGKSIEPRLFLDNENLYPQFVVFRKNL